MREWARGSTRLIAATGSAAHDAVRLLGVPAARIDVIPSGVDPSLFDGRRASPRARRAHWRSWLVDDPRGWSPADPRPGSIRYTEADLAPLETPGATIALYVGRFTAVKRAALLVRAHARARAALRRPLPLVLVGGAPSEWEGEHPAEAAWASPFRDEVYFAGWREQGELPAALAAADLLAAPSVAERFGQVYVEAMAMGVPPIACDAFGPPTFIDADPRSPSRAGWLVPPDDEVALSQVLVAAASDPAERAIRAANGRTLVERSFTWPRIAARTAAVYEEARAPAPGPSTESAAAIRRPPGMRARAPLAGTRPIDERTAPLRRGAFGALRALRPSSLRGVSRRCCRTEDFAPGGAARRSGANRRGAHLTSGASSARRRSPARAEPRPVRAAEPRSLTEAIPETEAFFGRS